MRKLLLAFCAFATICSAGAQWKPAGDKIKTDWAEKVDPQNIHAPGWNVRIGRI